MVIDEVKYLTAFNEGTYNNQPYFFSNNDLYLTSYVESEGQTDIIHLDLRSERLYEVTNTEQSEYSPTPVPGGKHFSCIKVYAEDNNAQFLWKYPISKEHGGSPVFKKIKNVGYHQWLNENEVAMFLVGDPHRFVIGNSTTQNIRLIIENIGRTFKLTKDNKLMFIHKINESLFYIKEYDPTLKRATIVAKTLEGKEDFDLLDDGSLVMGSGSVLYRYVPGQSIQWKPWVDLAAYGIEEISRIASSGNRIALVNTKP